MKIQANPLWIRVAIFAGFILSSFSVIQASPIGVHRPVSSVPDMTQAVTLIGQGKMKEADAIFQKLLEQDPRQLNAALGRAAIALTDKQVDQADQMINAVLKRDDSLSEAHNMKGLVLLLRKDSDGARSEFARAIKLKPTYITPHLYLAVMARQNGDYSAAANQYQSILQIAPHLSSGYLGEAEALTMERREPDALKVLESWKKADPKSLLPYQVIAEVYLSDHRPNDAIRELRAALARNSRDSRTLTLLGDAYRVVGDIPSAAAQYDAALTADHTNAAAAVCLGELEASAGQNERALSHFQMAAAADPNNAVAANDSAWLLADQDRNLNEALRLALLAVRLDPKYADAYDTLGWVRFHRREYVLALAALKQAQVLNPSSPDIAAHLGLTYSKSGHKQEAVVELSRALKPGNTLSNRPELEREVARLAAR
jgi:tetratricopeptide (TPR) repeat protein